MWLRGTWCTNLDLIPVCVRLPEVMKHLKNSSPIVACQVILDLVKIKICCLGPFRGQKITSVCDVIASCMHCITLLNLKYMLVSSNMSIGSTHGHGSKGQSTNQTKWFTRISGGNFCLNTMGGEVNCKSAKDRHRLEGPPPFLLGDQYVGVVVGELESPCHSRHILQEVG